MSRGRSQSTPRLSSSPPTTGRKPPIPAAVLHLRPTRLRHELPGEKAHLHDHLAPLPPLCFPSPIGDCCRSSQMLDVGIGLVVPLPTAAAPWFRALTRTSCAHFHVLERHAPSGSWSTATVGRAHDMASPRPSSFRRPPFSPSTSVTSVSLTALLPCYSSFVAPPILVAIVDLTPSLARRCPPPFSSVSTETISRSSNRWVPHQRTRWRHVVARIPRISRIG
jgi:hypothetical protein